MKIDGLYNLNPNNYPGSLFSTDFAIKAFNAGRKVYMTSFCISRSEYTINQDPFVLLNELGYKAIFHHLDGKFSYLIPDSKERYKFYPQTNTPQGKDGLFRAVYTANNIVIEIENNISFVIICIISTNERTLKRVLEKLKAIAVLKEKKPTGNVYTLVSSNGDLEIKSLGETSLELIKENYSSEVNEKIDHIIKDLASNNPCGKLSVINGLPGSGKTSLIRMLTKIVNRTFIYVPSQQLVDWSGPSLLNLLNETKETNLFPIVFIIEDADSCLVPRSESNHMNAISALLNLSDGILGSVFDIRIIATTNANISDYDPAITRNGRLCRIVNVNSLSSEQANSVYARLSGKDNKPFLKETLLADIYKYVNDPSSAPSIVKEQNRRIGFC